MQITDLKIEKFRGVKNAHVRFGSHGIALRAIQAQKNIARQRAAIDFFLKSEMDSEIVKHYATFRTNEERIRIADIEAITKFRANPKSDYETVRTWLNILEILAVGVHRHAFDEDVCFHYWRNVVTKVFRSSDVLIKYARSTPQGVDGVETYSELERLAKAWEKRIKREKGVVRRLFSRR